MDSFFIGFGEELLKLAANAGQTSLDQGQKKDVSQTAAAGNNLGVGSAAGQPEQPAGTPATTPGAGKGFGLPVATPPPGIDGKKQSLKGAI